MRKEKKLRRSLDIFKILPSRMILFYQRHISKHTCLYTPTCSEYTKRAINNFGAFSGTLIGFWRILRCNPFSKGGYDPAPERKSRLKWVL